MSFVQHAGSAIQNVESVLGETFEMRALRQDINTALEILKKHHAKRIILYGSTARGDHRPDSDLDICVEGIPAGEFFLAVGECLISVQRPVSVIDLAGTTGYFRERILAEGRLLYEG